MKWIFRKGNDEKAKRKRKKLQKQIAHRKRKRINWILNNTFLIFTHKRRENQNHHHPFLTYQTGKILRFDNILCWESVEKAKWYNPYKKEFGNIFLNYRIFYPWLSNFTLRILSYEFAEKSMKWLTHTHTVIQLFLMVLFILRSLKTTTTQPAIEKSWCNLQRNSSIHTRMHHAIVGERGGGKEENSLRSVRIYC